MKGYISTKLTITSFLLVLIILTSGCTQINTNIQFNFDDTGIFSEVIYISDILITELGYTPEQFFEHYDLNSDPNITLMEKEINGETYHGINVSGTFNSIDQLREVMEVASDEYVSFGILDYKYDTERYVSVYVRVESDDKIVDYIKPISSEILKKQGSNFISVELTLTFPYSGITTFYNTSNTTYSDSNTTTISLTSSNTVQIVNVRGNMGKAYPNDSVVTKERPFKYIRGYSNFEDVTYNDWFYSEVNESYAYGLINGESDIQFSPKANITLSQIFQMIANMASTYNKEQELLVYLQSRGDTWYNGAIEYLKLRDIISSDDFGTDYSRMITRSETCELFYRFILTLKGLITILLVSNKNSL